MPAAANIRRFSLQDQQAFARLSGDRNPIHVDPVRARRLLFGGPVVHGIHLVIWALDRLSEQTPIAALARVDARFDAAAPVGAEIEMEPAVVTDGEFRVRLRSGTRNLARFRFAPMAAVPTWHNPGPPPEETWAELDASTIAAASGSMPLGYDADDFGARFAGLAKFAPGQIAWLLASTRVIGMRVPGLHSIFTGLQVSFDAGAVPSRIAYRVANWDDRFHLVTVGLSGGGTGLATALLRPRTVDQPSLAAIAPRVASNRFAGASALVVGGSRGLGEAAVKLFAAGGAKVTFTYREGETEASDLAAEIAAAGGCALPLHLDVAAPEQALGRAGTAPFTHVVYCAAPRIRKGGATFDAALHDRYAEAFVLGLQNVLAAVEPHLAPAVTLIVPSTAYVSEPEPGFAEYAAAKAAGEVVARESAERLIARGRQVRLIQPRFGRLRTDQTAQPGSGNASDLADPADALLAVL